MSIAASRPAREVAGNHPAIESGRKVLEMYRNPHPDPFPQLNVGEGTQKASPAVSVIVLNHNGEKIIGKCLDHLLAQSFDDFEIVVVDNDSKDGSRAILEQYLGCGRLSIVHSRRNLGVAGGRNLGVMHAQGGIIAFI